MKAKFMQFSNTLSQRAQSLTTNLLSKIACNFVMR